jgi:hypothetical protein
MSIVKRHVALNKRLAQSLWGPLNKPTMSALKELLKSFRFAIEQGDLQYFGKGWYVTHVGLIRLAQRRRCAGIRVQPLREFCSSALNRWVFKATVYKSAECRGYAGYGDADPSNVSPLVRGAEMRVAETRAVNRALRKAYGIGLCSVEELGWEPKAYVPSDPQKAASHNNGPQNGNPRLRDRLCLLIRQHQLDANLVKAYATDSCGTPNLRDATREQIEVFITDLADWATKDRPGLLCKLNSYSRAQEVTS